MYNENEPIMSVSGMVLSSILVFVCLAGIVTLLMWGCPQYGVYQQRKAGEATLAHAQYSREVAVAEAKAKMESASLLAIADTLRAVGVAKANQIIGVSLKNNPEYLEWMWVDAIDKTQNQVIYVPAGQFGMPIMEANRLKPIVTTPPPQP